MDPQEVLKNPEKSYLFATLRPGGNDTALVLGVIRNPALRKEVNDAILDIYKNVEQVGFVDINPKAPELMMAGEEFCGNGTRSAAWLALNGQPGKVNIRVSGVNDELKAGVKPNGEAFAQMPIYADPSKITKDGNNRIVEMEGITLYINFNTGEIEGLSQEKMKQRAMMLIREKNLDRFPAAGVIYSQKEGNSWRITPIVYVKAVDTLYAETACGSGTTALGLVLALEKGGSIKDVPIIQPTNLPIKVGVAYDGKSFGYAQISGPVERLDTGILKQTENLAYAVEPVTSKKVLQRALTQDGLTALYKDIFGKAPYFESFDESEVEDIFAEYVRDGLLYIARSSGGKVVGFGAALPMPSVPDIARIVGISQKDMDRTWYMADLGVSDELRRKGIGRNLVLARLSRLPGANVVMRTSVNNIDSQKLYRSFGFQTIPNVSQTIERDRVVKGVPTKDKRIFMSKQL